MLYALYRYSAEFKASGRLEHIALSGVPLSRLPQLQGDQSMCEVNAELSAEGTSNVLRETRPNVYKLSADFTISCPNGVVIEWTLVLPHGIAAALDNPIKGTDRIRPGETSIKHGWIIQLATVPHHQIAEIMDREIVLHGTYSVGIDLHHSYSARDTLNALLRDHRDRIAKSVRPVRL
jgi:hypothetical protein